MGTIFSCKACDEQFPKWEGRCRECGAWDSLVAETRPTKRARQESKVGSVAFTTVDATPRAEKLRTGLPELDRVLGGGISPDLFALVGGDPGVGKSTLLLQLARALAEKSSNVLYVSGEESAEQVKERLERLGSIPSTLGFLGETSVDTIIAVVTSEKPGLVIIDSLQTLVNSEGRAARTPSDIAGATESLLELAKTNRVPIFLIGHVTKDGGVAGPKLLEHLVDTVLYLETGAEQIRILRAVKNRYGSTDEIGVWRMTNAGLEQLDDPAGMFVQQTITGPGSCRSAIVHGSRIFMVEVQALVNETKFSNPQRQVTGCDPKRLNQIIAIIGRHARFPANSRDILVNVVGGLKLTDPGTDAAVALAILSAEHQRAIDPHTILFGELGLQGELRPASDIERRVVECQRLGAKRIIIPHQKTSDKNALIAKTLTELVSTVWS